MTITEVAIKRPTLIVVIFAFLAVLGVFGYMQLKYELIPKMTAPLITITTVYPGGSPNEVETSITKVIEDAVSGLDKVSAVRSSSYEGRSMVIVEFDQTVNIDLVLQDAQRKVNEVSDRIPLTAKRPIISKIALDEIPVLRMALSSSLKPKEFYQYIKDNIQPRISKIEGVGQVVLMGGEEREIQVNFDIEKLKAFNISITQATLVIKGSNLDFPTGNVKDEKNQYVVRVAGKFSDVDQIRDLVLMRTKTGSDIKVKDVASVEDGIKETVSIYRLNGKPSVGLLVQKTNDGNSVDVSKYVRQEITKMETDYKEINLKFIIGQDGSEFTLQSADAVKEDLLIAVFLVAFVMIIFLHSIRNSVIVMIAIPSSLVSTFFLMWVFDFTLNTMTLLAMSLTIGILVDDSIVVLENIYRHLEKSKGESKSGILRSAQDDKEQVDSGNEEQKARKKAALDGRNEIGFAALSITLVDVVVFVPLALITGMIGNFLRQYALVVVFSTMMSLFVSFTVTPALASRFTKLEHLTKGTLMGRFGLFFENLFNKLTNYYARLLKWSLNNGWKVILLTFLLFMSTFMLMRFGFIGSEFIPVMDRGEFTITIELQSGSSLANTNIATLQIEKILSEYPEVDKIIANVGASSEGLIGQYTNYSSEISVTLVDKHQRKMTTDEFGMMIKKRIVLIPGIKVRVTPVSMMGTASRSPIQILVYGTKYEDVMKGAKMIADITKQIRGTTDVRLSSEEGKPELRIEIDREKMAQLGLTINDVGQSLRLGLTGDNDSRYRDGINEYDLRIYYDEGNRSIPNDVYKYEIANSKGQMIKLTQFAKIYQASGPTKLEREDRVSSVNVFSQVFNRTSGDIATEITTKMANVKMPAGVSFKFAGEQKTMRESFTSLLYAIIAAILFVYMIMVALYDSYIYPFVVLFSIPVAMIGALLALALTMKSISIYSLLGTIMLIGLVGKNAILLVDRTNQMRVEKGLSVFEALLEAGETRLRPILMTTVAMVMGMLPIAISTSAGSEAKSGLGVVLIGGLLSSMFLTLVLVPVMYIKLDKWKERLSRLFKKKSVI